MTLSVDTTSGPNAKPKATGLLYGLRAKAGSQRWRPIVYIPSEDVLIAVVDLPLASRRQRVAALPFAMEELISEPLSQVHMVLGVEIAPRRHVAAAVRHDVMMRLMAELSPEDAANCRVVPDALALAVPAEADWAVARLGARAVVRTADGGGFAIESSMLPAAWAAAGKPSIVSYGEALPPDMPLVEGLPVAAGVERDLDGVALDLRQGVYAPNASIVPTVAKWAAMLIGAGAIAHSLVAVVDVMALQNIAGAREGEARILLRQLAPSLPPDGDVVDMLNRIAPSVGGAPGVQFLPLMAETSQALQPFAGKVSVQSLAFAKADRSLALTMEGPDLATLQAVEQALGAAGLDPISGPATTDRGAAEFRVTVHAGGGGS